MDEIDIATYGAYGAVILCIFGGLLMMISWLILKSGKSTAGERLANIGRRFLILGLVGFGLVACSGVLALFGGICGQGYC